MPGILPMKVIKVGTSAQSRIAQACDRCRSKKIRCDGITPCCSQCANVGFECKTSDKLSRRAFPRGYTESLEERVRCLESEVKELKDLLDAKDENIDMLSRIRSNSPSWRRQSATPSSSAGADSRSSSIDGNVKADAIKVQQSPISNGDDGQDSYFTGPSSGRPFVDAFKAKLRDTSKQSPNFRSQVFFDVETQDAEPAWTTDSKPGLRMPSRMASDQMINIFFQEWASLFPILHRPTVLKLYSDFAADSDNIKDQHAMAQLFLVFGIAALSAEWNKHDARAFEPQWQTALDAVSKEISVPTLQCLILAQIYCIAKRDYEGLLRYKTTAVRISRRLGLHQSQKRSSAGPLTTETRKRVFWTLYTVDCFSCALLGQPRSLREEDIRCEYPQDVDDENVTEERFQVALPGESTRLSSALALFRGARILSAVVDEIYPAAASHQLSMQTVVALSEELDAWLADLPPHLRLRFVQDKPSTNVVGSRSPFLSLTYHYIRTLIHRPLASSHSDSRASTSIVALAQSSKHIIQIIQLLEERRMSFSFCLNKNHILILAGFGLLFQTFDLDRKGKLVQDSQRLLCSVMSILERNGAPGAADFKKVACSMISIDRIPKSARSADADASIMQNLDSTMPAPKTTSKSPRKIQSSMSWGPSLGSAPANKDVHGRRFTAPTISIPVDARNKSKSSIRSTASEPLLLDGWKKPGSISSSDALSEMPNLDYLDFGNDATPTSATNNHNADIKAATNGSSVKRQSSHELDTLFPSPDVFSYISESSSNAIDWCSDLWSIPTDLNNQPQPTRSTLSFSEEELTSGEELSSCGASGQFSAASLPEDGRLVALDGLDGGFGL